MDLIAKNVSKSFDKNKIVEPLDFEVESGSIHVIEGKSGSGKSTLLSMLGGMEKPDSGDVFINNKSLYQLSDREQSFTRGKLFGYVFQSFHLIPELTVKENIELPLKFNRQNNEAFDVNELAEVLGIKEQLNKKPGLLSGGEQQRVAIARAIITNPRILFADEPTGNLDSQTTSDIVELLTNLSVELGLALVIVTHEKRLFCARHQLYHMENGMLLKAGTKYA